MFKKVVVAIISLAIIAGIGFGIYIGIREGFFVDSYKKITDPITFEINDTLPDADGEVARVIILAGQSNASGCSRDEYLQKNVSAEKYAEYENGYDNIYINYFSSGKNLSNGFVKTSTCQGEEGGFFGPEIGMAEKLSELYPDEKFYIVKYAWGGTDLYDQWLSPTSVGKTGKRYKEFEQFVKTSLKYLDSKGYDVKIEGMCWMQGESDSFFVETATDYQQNLENLIKDVRRKFRRYGADDGIAFIDATIAYSPSYWVYGELVNESKRAVAESATMHKLIDTSDLICSEEPIEKPDIPHYDSMSELELGYRFIEALSSFM